MSNGKPSTVIFRRENHCSFGGGGQHLSLSSHNHGRVDCELSDNGTSFQTSRRGEGGNSTDIFREGSSLWTAEKLALDMVARGQDFSKRDRSFHSRADFGIFALRGLCRHTDLNYNYDGN